MTSVLVPHFFDACPTNSLGLVPAGFSRDRRRWYSLFPPFQSVGYPLSPFKFPNSKTLRENQAHCFLFELCIVLSIHEHTAKSLLGTRCVLKREESSMPDQFQKIQAVPPGAALFFEKYRFGRDEMARGKGRNNTAPEVDAKTRRFAEAENQFVRNLMAEDTPQMQPLSPFRSSLHTILTVMT